jgi:hypothetical protein
MDQYENFDVSKINKKKLKEKMKLYTSDDELVHYIGKNYKKFIIKYSDIEDYKSINQLLPYNHSFRIILIESDYNSGHWVALFRYNTTIEYFNSYGMKPSYEIDGNSYLKNKQLDQDTKHLNLLLNSALGKYDIIFNRVKFQKLNNDIATCGRHVLFRIVCFKKFKMNLHQYIVFIKELQHKFKLNADQLVTLFIDSHSK